MQAANKEHVTRPFLFEHHPNQNVLPCRPWRAHVPACIPADALASFFYFLGSLKTSDNLDYNSLKHEIKVHTTRDQATAIAIPGHQDTTLKKFEDRLYSELCRQHARVDLFISSKADEVSRRLGTFRLPPGFLFKNRKHPSLTVGRLQEIFACANTSFTCQSILAAGSSVWQQRPVAVAAVVVLQHPLNGSEESPSTRENLYAVERKFRHYRALPMRKSLPFGRF